METYYTCQTCNLTSIVRDWFRGLHLAIPQAPVTDSVLTVGDLVQHYLAPELLSGGNQYQCDNCNMLRDAVKTTRLSSAPDYLNITLLRFKYDRTTELGAKVFTTVDYPKELVLPVTGGGVHYRLYSVVIHSGYSSNDGHYYTWCSNPASSSWLLLNDSQVSQATWEQFKQQTRNDTAYLLFYVKIGAQEASENVVPPRLVMNKVIRDNNDGILPEEELALYRKLKKKVETRRKKGIPLNVENLLDYYYLPLGERKVPCTMSKT